MEVSDEHPPLDDIGSRTAEAGEPPVDLEAATAPASSPNASETPKASYAAILMKRPPRAPLLKSPSAKSASSPLSASSKNAARGRPDQHSKLASQRASPTQTSAAAGAASCVQRTETTTLSQLPTPFCPDESRGSFSARMFQALNIEPASSPSPERHESPRSARPYTIAMGRLFDSLKREHSPVSQDVNRPDAPVLPSKKEHGEKDKDAKAQQSSVMRKSKSARAAEKAKPERGGASTEKVEEQGLERAADFTLPQYKYRGCPNLAMMGPGTGCPETSSTGVKSPMTLNPAAPEFVPTGSSDLFLAAAQAERQQTGKRGSSKQKSGGWKQKSSPGAEVVTQQDDKNFPPLPKGGIVPAVDCFSPAITNAKVLVVSGPEKDRSS
eukprot:g2482.t1